MVTLHNALGTPALTRSANRTCPARPSSIRAESANTHTSPKMTLSGSMILISVKNGSAIYVASSPHRIEDRPSGVRGRFPSRPCSARWRDDGIPGDDRIHDRFPQRARSLHEKLETGRHRMRRTGMG